MEAVQKESIIQKRFVKPFLSFLKQGITPSKLSIAFTLGLLIGVLPLPGMTTIICSIICLLFRLNMAAMQLVNQVMYPVQLLLLIPFIRGGEYLLNSTKPLQLDMEQIIAMFKQDVLIGFQTIGSALGAGVVSWTLVSIPLYFFFYYIGLALIKKYAYKLKK